jgi:hypothetical protein
MHRNIWPLHLELWLRKQILGALHLQWHMRLVHLWESKELARLRGVGPNIASRRLSIKWRFSLAILLHFLGLVPNNNGFSNNVLEISVIGVGQLE